LEDFCARVDLRLVNRRVLESLSKAGAFDSLGLTRAHLLATADAALESGQRKQRDRAEGQASFFDLLPAGAPAPSAPVAEVVPEWEPDQRLAFEKEVLGFYVSGHPLARFRGVVESLGLTPTAENGGRHRVAAGEPNACRIRLAVATERRDALAALRQVCAAHPGRIPLFLHLLLGSQEVVVRCRGVAVDASQELCAKVESLLGGGTITVEYAGRA